MKAKFSFFENDIVIYLLLGLVILFVIITRVHLLTFPLERDEGEYAYMGKLILDGHAPYTLAYNMKYPGTYYMYAGIMAIFGKSIVGIRLGQMIIAIASIILMFFISKNFVSKLAAFIAAASFGIIGTSFGLLAQAAHATQFVTFFALLGIFFILQAYKNNRYRILKYLFSGIFFSFAFLCKQSGVFFIFFGYAIILFKEFDIKLMRIPWKNLLILTSGFVTPILLMFFALYIGGIFDKFWFWTFTYLSKYGTQVSVSSIFANFKYGISTVTFNYSSQGYVLLWSIALLALPLLFFTLKTKKDKLIISAFVLLSFLTVVPGFYFRSHYFYTLLPAAALLIVIFFEFFNRLFSEKLKQPILKFISLLTFLVIVGISVKANEDYLFKKDTKILSKWLYGSNAFVESLEIAKYIKKNTNPDDKIVVLGSEPQIYFYADRYSATGYIYMYGLMEDHPYATQMQKEMIDEIESNRPEYLIYVNEGCSWLPRAESDKFIFDWIAEQMNKHYELVGIMNLTTNKIAPLEIRNTLQGYKKEEQFVYILKREEQVFSMLERDMTPIPVSNDLIVDCDDFSTVIFYDTLGKEVINKDVKGTAQINIRHLPEGVYIVRIFSEDELIKHTKILKQ
ncbi:MAG: glycosyltransferase family 39 protein [Firmicutes bacterium]|nr:glycosyltransferase family 39 protein [Bacillota bacterium]